MSAPSSQSALPPACRERSEAWAREGLSEAGWEPHARKSQSPPSPLIGLRGGRRRNRSGGAISGEKAMRATLEWQEGARRADEGEAPRATLPGVARKGSSQGRSRFAGPKVPLTSSFPRNRCDEAAKRRTAALRPSLARRTRQKPNALSRRSLPSVRASSRPKAKSLQWSDFRREGHKSCARMAGVTAPARSGGGRPTPLSSPATAS